MHNTELEDLSLDRQPYDYNPRGFPSCELTPKNGTLVIRADGYGVPQQQRRTILYHILQKHSKESARINFITLIGYQIGP